MATFNSPTIEALRGSKPVGRIQPTSAAFIWVTVIVVLSSLVASFFLSAQAQMYVAALFGVKGVFQLAMPIAIDAPLVAFALAALAKRARGEGVIGSFIWIGIFGLASIAINVVHTLEVNSATGWGVAVLVGVSVLIPLAVIGTSGAALSILVAPPQGDRPQLQALARVADREAHHAIAPIGTEPRKVKAGSAVDRDLQAAIQNAYTASESQVTRQELAQRHRVSVSAVDRALKALKQQASA